MSLPGSQKKWARIACLTLLLAWVPQGAWGEPVTTIRNNGDSANRVDVAILGDGYTASELGKYATDVETFIQDLFAQEPFREYQRYFNIHRVDVTSNQSGADHPERNPPVFVDTALDATYNCSGIQRLICVDSSKVNGVVSSSLSSDRRDVILVIVNDAEYGGSGGAIAVTSVHSTVVDVILHELGHSFGLLADEYGGPPPSCNSSIEPPEVNATMQTQREQIKWNYWIDLSTPVPTTGTAAGVPGLYEGARYCDTGLYRPTHNSKMRHVDMPFEQINSEQLVKRFYNWVSPIDASEPSVSTVTITQGQNQTFRVQVPQPSTHSLNIAWKVDSQTMGTSADFTLISSSLTLGSHMVEITVSDPTLLVRNDSAGVLTESRTWNVNVTNGGHTPKAELTSPTPGSTLPGSAVTFTWTTGSGVSQYWLSVGSTAGSQDLYNQSQGTNLSVTVSGLPTDGRTLYVRLWSFINGIWEGNDYTYTAAGSGGAELTVTTSSLPTGETEVAYTYNLQAEGGMPPYTWSLAGGKKNKLPQGLTLASDGTLSGIPTKAKTATFTVQVTDASYALATQNLTLQIVKGVKLKTKLSKGKVGTPYSATLQTTGGIPPLTFSLVGGALPPGLTPPDPATGQIAGTPTTAGTFNFQVRVASSSGSSDQRSIQIKIK